MNMIGLLVTDLQLRAISRLPSEGWVKPISKKLAQTNQLGNGLNCNR
jgi:hypothetical protein